MMTANPVGSPLWIPLTRAPLFALQSSDAMASTENFYNAQPNDLSAVRHAFRWRWPKQRFSGRASAGALIREGGAGGADVRGVSMGTRGC